MSKSTTEYVMPGWLRLWEQFWFTPADPSLLGFIRIACGLVTVYTFVVYSFNFQDFMGEGAWHDMQLRDLVRHERPVAPGTFGWNAIGDLPKPKPGFQTDYVEAYKKKWKTLPPAPFPIDQEEADEYDVFFRDHLIDLRVQGLRLPARDDEDRKYKLEYASEYTKRWKVPPPAYVKDNEEALAVARYMEQFQTDPRRLYDKGMPVWSLFFHIREPGPMLVIHWGFVACSVLFLFGFCTRISTALTWFGLLNYIHRNPTTLFGVDTMMLIVLFYLMISPCGAVCSVDAVIRRWWVHAKPGFVASWYRFWKKELPAAIVPATPAEPMPSVSANVAIRCLQIHVCIIYLFAGLSKLQGQAWWTGSALWLTLGNYEFAPMQFGLYLTFLRYLGRNQWAYDGFMTFGGLFTLAFEIGYAFLIWRPRLRWVMLGSAILLHGFIGLFMGLKTFSLMMLVMNMAFLTKDEVLWFLGWFGPWSRAEATVAQPPPTLKQPIGAGTATAITKK